MNHVSLIVDGRTIVAVEGTSLLKAAQAAGIEIPNLCHDPRVDPIGGCRLCAVRIDGRPGLPLACLTPVSAGLRVTTRDEELDGLRKGLLELIFAEHRADCPTCDREGRCKLQDYAYVTRADPSRFGGRRPRSSRPNYASRNRGIAYDRDKCIRCGLCVKYCSEVQMAEALTFAGRGEAMDVSTAFGTDLHETSCELCGGCIRVCPAGAMLDRAAIGQGRDGDLGKVKTVCPYCGVGCTLELNVNRRLNRVVRVTAQPGQGINDGNLCVKGHFAFDFIHAPERLTVPLIKENGAFREASWAEALERVGRGLAAIRDTHGPDSVAFTSSSRCTNEENYLMQKLARAAGRTNNIDQCATTCHAPTVAGLASSLGSGAMTNAIREIQNVQTLFLIGANPTEAHPIVGLEMKKALRRGARLIVCDPRETWMAARAHIHIKHRPGTDNFLVNAMMNHIVEKDLHHKEFIQARCENFETFRENVGGYPVEEAAKVCGVDADLIRKAAEWYAAGTPSSIFYTLGITEHTCGTENVQNLANLAMLCGQIGKESSGINPLRGQNNVQGACDMGAMNTHLPGYQKVADPAVREKFAAAWGVPVPTDAGGKLTDFFERAGAGKIKALYAMGEDFVLSEPNSARIIEDLSRLDLLVCQDIFMSETAKLAHVVFPAACFAEKDGTFTNTERRVQRVRKAVEPPGQARADWQIVCEVAAAMGYPMSYSHPSDIWDELAALSPLFAGISYPRIETMGLQWPCPDKEHPGTPYLHANRFTRGLGLFHVIRHRPPAEVPDEQYPMILSTGRTLYNYNIGNMTRKSGVIGQKQPENFVELHGDDAARLGVREGGEVRVSTRRGSLVVGARVSSKVRPGALWMPFHYAESPANTLTNDAFDTVTRTAEYKCCAARIERVGAGGA